MIGTPLPRSFPHTCNVSGFSRAGEESNNGTSDVSLTILPQWTHTRLVVYYEETKREVKRILIYECRCNERQKVKGEGSIRLGYTRRDYSVGDNTELFILILR